MKRKYGLAIVLVAITLAGCGNNTEINESNNPLEQIYVGGYAVGSEEASFLTGNRIIEDEEIIEEVEEEIEDEPVESQPVIFVADDYDDTPTQAQSTFSCVDGNSKFEFVLPQGYTAQETTSPSENSIASFTDKGNGNNESHKIVFSRMIDEEVSDRAILSICGQAYFMVPNPGGEENNLFYAAIMGYSNNLFQWYDKETDLTVRDANGNEYPVKKSGWSIDTGYLGTGTEKVEIPYAYYFKVGDIYYMYQIECSDTKEDVLDKISGLVLMACTNGKPSLDTNDMLLCSSIENIQLKVNTLLKSSEASVGLTHQIDYKNYSEEISELLDKESDTHFKPIIDELIGGSFIKR